LISGLSKKVIFLSFLFVNFIQPSTTAELSKINNRNIRLTLSNKNSLKIPSNYHKNSSSNDFDDYTDYVKFLKKKTDSLLVAKAENQQELIIQSD